MSQFISKSKKTTNDVYRLVIAAGKGFSEDKVPKLSSSLAYCTIFSIAPLLTLIIASASLIYKKEAIEGKLFHELNQIMGDKMAHDIQEFVANATLSGKSNIALALGIISLIIGATAVFTEIQDSINTIWNIRTVPKKGWKKFLLNRLVSFSLIISLGFLLLVSLIISSVLVGLQGHIVQLFPNISWVLFDLLNFIITLLVITFLFAVIFKVLPDVILPWKPAMVGAFFTAILFMIGKYLIQLYITRSNPGTVFGAAGSLVVLLVWIYYTSFILYFGAEFTKAYAEQFGEGIKPTKYAVHIKTVIEIPEAN